MTQTSKNPDKIKYVSLVRGRWVYRPYIKTQDRHRFPDVDRNGFIKPVKLGVAADPLYRIVQAHAAVLEHFSTVNERDRFTLRWIVDQYTTSPEFDNLAQTTRTSYKGFVRILDHELKIARRNAAMGKLYLDELSLPTIKQIRDKRLKEYQRQGKAGYSQCNREISALSSAVQWGLHQFDELTKNPFRGLKALQEPKRTRYVTDVKYKIQYEQAKKIGYLYLPIVFELAYLLSCRGTEVCDLKISDTDHRDDDGNKIIKVPRRKGSKTTHIIQSPRLAKAISDAKALHKIYGLNNCQYLVPASKGGKLNKATVDTAMQRLKKRMTARKLFTQHTYVSGVDTDQKPLFWALHNLKRKGISDATVSRIGGHKSATMREHYDTKLEVFEAPG